MKFRKIEILAEDSNKKGDLFGRLMSDLFHTLGYDEPRLNIHKSGRELDIFAFHRTEDKVAVAECKAHETTIGGADINKFVGTLDAEKRKFDKSEKKISVVGYFVSASGFKETAIQQEIDCNNERVILIKPEKIVEELIKGRIIVSVENAVSILAPLAVNLSLCNHYDLLAYNRGWVWVFYYSQSAGQEVTHFGFVHAEGKPLVKNLAESIISIDNNLNKIFDGLTLLYEELAENDVTSNLFSTRNKYFKYLENELGDIQFEGLPTDKEAGSVKVKLENIFVPLHFQQAMDEEVYDDDNRESIGQILDVKSKLAILAKPGGGKSTLIKRIAIAYAFPERRSEIQDSLPDKDWFPIFLRCRELGDKVTQSINETIRSIPIRAEIPECSNDFSIMVSECLQNGKALLLIDGLDEIAEDKNRIAFVNQLRTFIATYPSLNIIITSREAGFRAVAGALASHCDKYTVSNLIDSEIKELTLKWHKAIIDDSENTIKEANKLSEVILKDLRIKALAENPLLLTTLLFVKRWAGYLPTKRSILYQEMIKLLLVTWNVEGHEILDIEEAEPQLAFVAYWMTKNGQQTITSEELHKCLIDARKQMPEILGYTKVNPTEFIRRVESRSSLLILSGHHRDQSGHLTMIYEFLHLSFQEYLTAKAVVKKFLPTDDLSSTFIDLIKPNLNNEYWKEVIPLIAVFLERESKELVEFLIEECKDLLVGVRDPDKLAPILLGNCLANEIQINPDVLDNAIEWYAKSSYSYLGRSTTETILKNKFGQAFRAKLKGCFFEEYDDRYASTLGSMLADIYLMGFSNQESILTISEAILLTLKNGSDEEKCIAILGLMGLIFNNVKKNEQYENENNVFIEIFILLNDLLENENDNLHLKFAIAWAIAWSGDKGIFPDCQRQRAADLLTADWVAVKQERLNRVIGWALFRIVVPSMNNEKILKISNIKNIIIDKYTNSHIDFAKIVAVFIGTNIGEKFNHEEVTQLFKNHNRKSQNCENFDQFSKLLKIKYNKKST